MADQVFDLKLQSLADTERFGRLLGALAEPGDVILLTGPLGAGKTALTRFIGAGLAVPPQCYITSPTFSLMHEYPGRLTMYHMDLYRLAGEEEIEEIGFLEYIYGEGLSVIEWPDRLGSLLPEEYLEVALAMRDESSRAARVTLAGGQWHHRAGEIRSL